MTRDDALLGLLAVEPATRAQLWRDTGWPIEETDGVLDRLVAVGLVTYRNGNGGKPGARQFMPKGRNGLPRINGGAPDEVRAHGERGLRAARSEAVRQERAVVPVGAAGAAGRRDSAVAGVRA